MVIWQSECCVGSFVLSRTLSSFSLCKTLILGVYNLFEATIYNYFRHTGEFFKAILFFLLVLFLYSFKLFFLFLIVCKNYL